MWVKRLLGTILIGLGIFIVLWGLGSFYGIYMVFQLKSQNFSYTAPIIVFLIGGAVIAVGTYMLISVENIFSFSEEVMKEEAYESLNKKIWGIIFIFSGIIIIIWAAGNLYILSQIPSGMAGQLVKQLLKQAGSKISYMTPLIKLLIGAILAGGGTYLLRALEKKDNKVSNQ